MSEREQSTDETQVPAPQPGDSEAESGATPPPGEQEERELDQGGSGPPPPPPPEPGVDPGIEAVAVDETSGLPTAGAPLSQPAPAVDHAATTPDRGDASSGDAGSGIAAERPELLVGAALAGGLAVAVLLRLVGRG